MEPYTYHGAYLDIVLTALRHWMWRRILYKSEMRSEESATSVKLYKLSRGKYYYRIELHCSCLPS